MTSLKAGQIGRIAEISGWDTDQNFFVEKALLSRVAEGNSKVALRTRLRLGSLVFVRVPDDASMDRPIPVTYQVATIDGKVKNGTHEIQLTRLRPRNSPARTVLQFTLHESAPN